MINEELEQSEQISEVIFRNKDDTESSHSNSFPFSDRSNTAEKAENLAQMWETLAKHQDLTPSIKLITIIQDAHKRTS